MKELLENFRLAKYRFILRPEEIIKLNRYAGSSLRNGFGETFKEICCTEKNQTSCEPCPRAEDCPYYFVMEQRAKEESSDSLLKRFRTPPKPFVFDPPLSKKSIYRKNEDLIFDLLLIGEALAYFPYFVATLRRMGEKGIGRNQGKFQIRKILGIDLFKDQIVGEYTFESNQTFNRDISVTLWQLFEKYKLDSQLREISVSFLTPLRMKRVGSENWHLHFGMFIRNVVTRVSNLALYYCNCHRFYNFSDIIGKARTVQIVRENLIWEEWRKPPVQPDQERVPRLGGYLGEVVYQGQLESFWPWLKIAEILHIGKNCGFGLGRVMIERLQ